MSKRDVVASLLAKANDPAATASEAAEAIKKARAIAERIGLSIDDIKNGVAETEDFLEDWLHSGERCLHPVDLYTGVVLGEFTACKVWRDYSPVGGHRVKFFGHAADVELAKFLRNTFRTALENDWSTYRRYVVVPEGRNVKAARQTFTKMFCTEVNDVMRQHMRQRDEISKDSKALVVLKNSLMESKWAEKGMVLGKTEGRTKTAGWDSAAARAGSDSGKRVDFGRGVGNGGGALAIGKD